MTEEIRKRLKRPRRSMMFLNAQRPGLLKDAYVYRPDTLMIDLEDAVAENQKDSARFFRSHHFTSLNVIQNALPFPSGLSRTPMVPPMRPTRDRAM